MGTISTKFTINCNTAPTIDYSNISVADTNKSATVHVHTI